MTDEPDMFATSDDLERRWHKLTDEERQKADTHLADVTEYIKERSPIWRRLLDERPRLLTKITCDIVRRIMQAEPYDIPGGITQMNQTTGSFSEQYSFGAPTGESLSLRRAWIEIPCPLQTSQHGQIGAEIVAGGCLDVAVTELSCDH